MNTNIKTVFELLNDDKTKDIAGFIKYIDNAFDREHGDSIWIDENGRRLSADVGYAYEWWRDCMRPELIRVLSK